MRRAAAQLVTRHRPCNLAARSSSHVPRDCHMPITGTVIVAAAMAFGVFLVVMAFSFASRSSQMRHEERLRMIEKGMVPPAAPIQGWPGVKAQEQQLRFEERRLMI